MNPDARPSGQQPPASERANELRIDAPHGAPHGARERALRSQRGEGRLSLVFWLVVLALAGIMAFEAIPVRYRMAQLQDFMVESAERARFSNDQQLKKAILVRANELDLPLTEKALNVVISGGRVKIDAEYTVTLDFLFYAYEWDKKHEVNRTIYYW